MLSEGLIFVNTEPCKPQWNETANEPKAYNDYVPVTIFRSDFPIGSQMFRKPYYKYQHG